MALASAAGWERQVDKLEKQLEKLQLNQVELRKQLAATQQREARLQLENAALLQQLLQLRSAGHNRQDGSTAGWQQQAAVPVMSDQQRPAAVGSAADAATNMAHTLFDDLELPGKRQAKGFKDSAVVYCVGSIRRATNLQVFSIMLAHVVDQA